MDEWTDDQLAELDRAAARVGRKPSIAAELRCARQVIEAARLAVQNPDRGNLLGLRDAIRGYDKFRASN